MEKSLLSLIIASVLVLSGSCVYNGSEFTEYDNDNLELAETIGDAQPQAIAPAFALPNAWTTVGSAGTVDEGDVGLVSLTSNAAEFASTAPASESIVIRYNVTATDGIHAIVDNMTVRYRDNGADARVVVSLRQYNINTGLTSTIATFDSNTVAASASIQTQVIAFGGCAFDYDFAANAYFVEATLTRTTAGGTPLLSAVQLSGHNLC